jgi:hypothetical protein
LQALIAQSPLAGQPLSFGQSGLGGPTAPQTDGCFMSVEGATNNPVASSKQYGQYIWRWGVLLAADAQARALFPFLPNAPQSEIDAVGGSGV